MKNQFLITCLAAALLAGCSKEAEMLDGSSPATHISAKATSAESPTTKAPLTGTSLQGQQAQIYTTFLPLESYTSDKATMFTNAYAYGTMTFADNSYVMYDPASLMGLSALPIDKSPVYLYGFYPTGWAPELVTGTSGVYESLSYTFDGKTDLMATWLTAADQQQIAYSGGMSGTLPEKAEFMFRHLLTCYNIRVVGDNAMQVAGWGRVKSVQFKEATVNKVSTGENLGYNYSAGGGVVSFYKLTGTTTVPIYSDATFEQGTFDKMLPLTTTVQPACYAMAAPVTVDASTSTPELTLRVVTLAKAGDKETVAEIPISLDQSKFAANGNSTRGYTVSITLKFTAESIAPTATIGEWAAGDTYEQEVLPPDLAIGDEKDGGVVYWIDPANPKNYSVTSVVEAPSALAWAAKATYVIGSDAQSDTDAKTNAAAIKAYYDTQYAGGIIMSTFDVAFPAAYWCYNYQGQDGSEAQGSWYLPAKTDLQYLWCGFNGKAATTWADGYATAPTPDTEAQARFNKALTDAGGAQMTSNSFWSSTESSISTSLTWNMSMANGDTNGINKRLTASVRCVKHTTDGTSPTPPPGNVNVGDEVKGGLVFWVSADKAHYKIVYAQPVKNSEACWSGKATYAVGCTDAEDGRVNVAKMEAYSRDHVSDANADTKTTGVFATDFPMASWCKALSTADTPAGQWYMPAVNEMKEIVNQKTLLEDNGFVVGAKWMMTSSEVVGNLSEIYLWQHNQTEPMRTYTKTLFDNRAA